MYGVGHGDHHDDYGHPRVRGAEHNAAPAGEPHGGIDDEHDHGNDGQRAGGRAQKQDRSAYDDDEHDRRQRLQVVLRGIGKGAVHYHVACEMVGDVRMPCSGVAQDRTEIVGYFNDGLIRVLRQDEVDGHACRASIVGNQAPGDFGGFQRDPFNARRFGVAQRPRVLDERRDNQVVTRCFAVRVVCEGVDAAGIRRTPRGPGHLFNRDEGIAGEN